MKNKVLITIVTRNNKVLLLHLLDSIERFDAGYDYDVLLIDAESDNKDYLLCLEKLSKKYKVQRVIDDRVETSYDTAWRTNKNYKYYYFMHDDCCILKENWLKAFVDKMNSGHCEEEITNTHLRYFPIGKVSEGNHFWRSYSSVKGFPVQCLFMKPILEILYPGKVPEIFKQTEMDRVLFKNECLLATDGVRNLKEFEELQRLDKEKFSAIFDILNSHLTYFDEGSYPKEIYPSGQCWNKFSLVTEFLDSIDPLIHGWRGVGLYDEGYLEQIHGKANPRQYKYIAHYGNPCFIEFVAKQFKSPSKDVRKHFGNKVFLMKMDMLINEYNKKANIK